MPPGTGRAALLLFSPGLGGDTGAGRVWGEAWASGGFMVIHVQHPGSDSAVYAGTPTPAEKTARFAAATGFAQLRARVADMRFVIDEASRRRHEGACNLQRIDPDHIGVAGHSMGAWTVQALAGQRWPLGILADRRVRAAIAFSPSAPFVANPADSFGRIGIPFLSITGSLDGVPLGANPQQRSLARAERTTPFHAMPAGQKILLEFGDGDHMAFSGNGRRADTAVDAHIRDVSIRASLAFWRASLMGSRADANWLAAPDGLRAELLAGDRVESK